MDMPGRSVTPSDSYRYGMNGQNKDNEVFEGFTSADFWGYDSRLGRRWEVDPISYPWQSPYTCFNNNPVFFSDPLGLEGGPAKFKLDFDPKDDDNVGGRINDFNAIRISNKIGDGWGKYSGAEFLRQSQNYKNKVSAYSSYTKNGINWTYKIAIDNDGVSYLEEYQSNNSQIINYYWMRNFNQDLAESWVYMNHRPAGLPEVEVDLDAGFNNVAGFDNVNIRNIPPVNFNGASWNTADDPNFNAIINQLNRLLENNPNATLIITGSSQMNVGVSNNSISGANVPYTVLKQNRADAIRNALIDRNITFMARILTAISPAGSNARQSSYVLRSRNIVNRIGTWFRRSKNVKESNKKF